MKRIDSVNGRRLVDSGDESCAGDALFETAGAGALSLGPVSIG